MNKDKTKKHSCNLRSLTEGKVPLLTGCPCWTDFEARWCPCE